jgi:peptidoglycan/xylan/chitin deacetylase (PgdA/CDA1 family)
VDDATDADTLEVAGVRIAWTIDDAPSIADVPEMAPDPARMDRMRGVLRDAGINHCVAFVIGRHAEGNEPYLERWLEDGFELGNHTWDHVGVSGVSADEFLRSVERCDRVLARVGAFDDGRPRWFRYPFLDRGTPESHSAVRGGIADLGYRPAPVSFETFDHRYEGLLGRARSSGRSRTAARVRRHFVFGALSSLAAMRLAAARQGAAAIDHVACSHFGDISDVAAAELIGWLRRLGIEFIPLETALAAPAYADYDQDPHRKGSVFGQGLSRPERALRQALQVADHRGWLGPRSAGPRFPHLW